jgi:hypothetical protein
MKKVLLTLVLSLITSSSFAESIDPPTYKPGDTWLYQSTIEKGATGWNQSRSEITISRTTSTSIYYTSKPSGSTQPPQDKISGSDWSRLRNVNGKETLINKPLSFPLFSGKTWEVQYTEKNPNKDHKSEQWASKYTVVDTEPIEVPAGKFNAIKIEAEGTWTAEMEPKASVVQGVQATSNGTTMITQTQKPTTATITGRTYKAFWYVPEIKRWVKSVEEYYNVNGERTERYTDELISFKLQEQHK